jgi:hypothetical protein
VGLLLNDNAGAVPKFVPVTVTVVPPAVVPVDGETEVMVGPAIGYVTITEVWPLTVIETDTEEAEPPSALLRNEI